jgi:hypothetical protein
VLAAPLALVMPSASGICKFIAGVANYRTLSTDFKATDALQVVLKFAQKPGASPKIRLLTYPAHSLP